MPEYLLSMYSARKDRKVINNPPTKKEVTI
jgi:hypothetical protein